MRILFYTDFDGTITGTAGLDLVFTPFYSSLLVDESRYYRNSPMKEPDALQQLFEKEFGRYDESGRMDLRLMSLDTVAFLH